MRELLRDRDSSRSRFKNCFSAGLSLGASSGPRIAAGGQAALVAKIVPCADVLLGERMAGRYGNQDILDRERQHIERT